MPLASGLLLLASCFLLLAQFQGGIPSFWSKTSPMMQMSAQFESLKGINMARGEFLRFPPPPPFRPPNPPPQFSNLREPNFSDVRHASLWTQMALPHEPKPPWPSQTPGSSAASHLGAASAHVDVGQKAGSPKWLALLSGNMVPKVETGQVKIGNQNRVDWTLWGQKWG